MGFGNSTNVRTLMAGIQVPTGYGPSQLRGPSDDDVGLEGFGPSSDVAPKDAEAIGGSAYAQAATNRSGADAALVGGIGVRLFTSVSNTAGAVTVTIQGDGAAVALVSGVDFTLGSDNTSPQKAVTATNLAAAMNANATIAAACTAVASAAIVYLTKTAGVRKLVISTNQVARISATSGPDGAGVAESIHGPDRAVDSAALPMLVKGGSAYPRATTNTGGADLQLAGGIGRRFCTSILNDAGAVTITITVNGTAVALASTTDFTLGSDNTAPQLAVTAVNLAAAINANVTLGPLVVAAASTDKVYITPKAAVRTLTIATNQAGRISVTSGTDGVASVVEMAITKSSLTAGDLTKASDSLSRQSVSKFTWTNAQVVALGANLTGDLKVCTLPAKTVVRNVYLVADTQAAGTDTLTGAVGRVGAGYIDYIVASDLKAAAGTVYGDTSGERGTNLTGYDLPSYSAAVDVFLHFVATDAGANKLANVTGCTGTVILVTQTLP